ncbi:ABC transporter [Chryseobacterium sp. Leaf180]|uniref:sulfate/molybdate ABC transporter ATP-binding protein n=1 Tax=Chryseobacterium sp. Leaf180 TaxID=1736289 RepID=UPI0006F9AA68|nr:ABC transporter ATP-binding protein [Chryseobacterium sp. Leaf180]KQR92636.1 ABC transporter [Chryseobacterium sp. Leaf180]
MLLKIDHLHFSHQRDQVLFEDFSLEIEREKIIALAGESGCGKSTLLSLIYGLLDWEKGEIYFENTKLLGPKGNLVPGESQMKLVAQNFDLMPYATVAENVGKFISNINLKEKKETVSELLDVVGLTEFSSTLPKKLSGGQQQRVAIARALSVMPKLLLLDEPFSNLDFARKIELRDRLFDYVKKNKITLIISTHELQDLLPWLDEIVILKEGKVVQKGDAESVYKNPESHYVATLFGEVNLFSEEEISIFKLKKPAYFPNEIVLSENGFEAEVLESRFAGNYFWNKILVRNKTLILYTDEKISGRVNISFKN